MLNAAPAVRGTIDADSFSIRIAIRTVFALLLSTTAASAVTLVHRPYLQNMTADHVSIVWSTRENLTGVVQYSADQSFSSSAAAMVRAFPPSVTGMAIPFYQYQADLNGLSAGTSYSYRVVVDGQNLTPEPERRFRTVAAGPFSFLVFGDSGLGTPPQQAIALLMAAEKPDLTLHVGDIAYEHGTFEEFQANYFEYYWSIMRRVPFFPVAGNHEYITQNSAPYLALHAPPGDDVPQQDRGRYYSFDWGDVHFIALDSDLLAAGFASGPMMAWLESDLQRSVGARWRIAYFHHLPYPISHHIDDPICAATRTQFVPLLERYGVQLVLTGHEHNYQRTLPMRGDRPVSSGRATTYIVSGGGGGNLHDVAAASFLAMAAAVHHYLRVEVDANQITVHAIGQDGKEFDRVRLVQPVLASGSSVLSGASFLPEVAPGGLVSIFGTGLAAGTSQAAGLPWPGNLSGTTVTVDGIPAPVTFASPSQVNAQLPLDTRDTAILRVSTASGFSETIIRLADTAPAIFPNGILHANGTPVSASSPVTAGETLVVYATGLGQVDGRTSAGQPAPSSPLLNCMARPDVQIGDISVIPFFAGLTPGLAGVYQVNLVVPADLPARAYSVRLAMKGIFSNTYAIQVQSRTP